MSGERVTEARNPRARDLSSMSTTEILELMNDEDATVPQAVRRALPEIASAVDLIVARLQNGGRLRYVGAGTSGRLGVLDASEAPPTFGVGPDLVRGIIAGGDRALHTSVEGAEDSAADGEADTRAAVRADDALVGVSASGRAPYVVAAVRAAREIGAATACVTCVEGSALAQAVDVPVVVDVGPEVLAGSSRLKAGTATKLVLNMLSTAAMVRLGRTRGDLMVDMRPTNEKLRERAISIVMQERRESRDEAARRLEANGWDVRKALDG